MSVIIEDQTKNDGNPVIYVTGFGPFGRHTQNASQVIVEKLQSTNIESKLNIKLYTDVLPVSYESVQKKVPNKWKELKPKLVIHIGVSDLAKGITLEKQAFNDKYCQLDVNGCLPWYKECIQGNQCTLKTKLDLKSIKEKVTSMNSSDLDISLSNDPGRYLCGFIYYTSLNIDDSRSVFIHVPTLEYISTNPAQASSILIKSICSVIEALYSQVCKVDQKNETDVVNGDLIDDNYVQNLPVL